MAPLSKVSGIEYALFTRSDSEEMASLLGDAFAKHDPPAVAVGLTSAEFKEFVWLLCTNPTMDSLTIVARSESGGEMVGALLAEDSSSRVPAGIEHLSAKFNPIFDILGKLEFAYRGKGHVTPGESAHLFLLAVAERFIGRGIAQQLVGQSITYAAQKGYCLAVTEATNRTSQHIFRKAGFAERAVESYKDFRYQGKAPFESIEDHGGPILMDIQLSN